MYAESPICHVQALTGECGLMMGITISQGINGFLPNEAAAAHQISNLNLRSKDRMANTA